jgi:hypothetical protein
MFFCWLFDFLRNRHQTTHADSDALPPDVAIVSPLSRQKVFGNRKNKRAFPPKPVQYPSDRSEVFNTVTCMDALMPRAQDAQQRPMIFTLPPQISQQVMSIWNTHFSRCAQPIDCRFSAALCGACGGRLPRPLNVTCDRSLLFGANTPWNRVKFTHGLGTSAANLAMATPAHPCASLRPWHTVHPVHKVQWIEVHVGGAISIGRL